MPLPVTPTNPKPTLPLVMPLYIAFALSESPSIELFLCPFLLLSSLLLHFLFRLVLLTVWSVVPRMGQTQHKLQNCCRIQAALPGLSQARAFADRKDSQTSNALAVGACRFWSLLALLWCNFDTVGCYPLMSNWLALLSCVVLLCQTASISGATC